MFLCIFKTINLYFIHLFHFYPCRDEFSQLFLSLHMCSSTFWFPLPYRYYHYRSFCFVCLFLLFGDLCSSILLDHFSSPILFVLFVFSKHFNRFNFVYNIFTVVHEPFNNFISIAPSLLLLLWLKFQLSNPHIITHCITGLYSLFCITYFFPMISSLLAQWLACTYASFLVFRRY